MDTEGLGANGKSAHYDYKIFLLSVIFSSCFLYNSKEFIDRDAIDKLYVCVKEAKNIM